MKGKIIFSSLMLIVLEAPLLGYADEAAPPVTYVNDSLITAKIKAKLAAEHFSSLTQINVETDKDGAVWLTGTAATKEDVDKALAIASSTEGVISVKSQITVKPTK